jgi:tRNA wybutosine-synthesizing protein 2
MFSRGNVKEKARLMTFPAVSDRTSDHWAIDLYAGIGYFVFSYVKLGYRVLCWEINPWSIEGLRRGAIANGWTVKVVQRGDLATPLDELITGGEQIVVLSESNEKALGQMEALRQSMRIEHVNCGFLPTSRPVWEAAWKMTSGSTESWLHLHDNVGTKEVDGRKEEIQSLYNGWAKEGNTCSRNAMVEHVEYVKTYAPDVWHCVFDVHITRPQPAAEV